MNSKNEKFLKFEDFLNENGLQEEEIVNEATIEGYKYKFKFEGKDYIIEQGTEDESIFGVKDKDGEWTAMTKGNLFDPENYEMNRNEFLEFLQRGIKYFNVRNPVEISDVRDSEWAKFFKFELKDKPGRLKKRYVIIKLHCGKAACKWITREK